MTKKLPKGKSLAEVNPKLAKEWHPTLNGKLTPSDVSFGAIKKVWWKCEKGDDHVWESTPNGRSKGTGCPICSGRKVVKSNCLATTNPNLISQWHQSLNGKVTPFDVMEKSNKKYWWVCEKEEEHIWETSPNARSRGQGCPYCSGKKVSDSNSFKNNRPDLLQLWDYTKNIDITPKEVSIGSDKKVWWLCEKNKKHTYRSSIYNRVKGKGCPYCAGQKVDKTNSFASSFPELLNLWNYDLNKKNTPDEVVAGSTKKVWWKCLKEADHIWKSSVVNISLGKGCPFCAGKKITTSNCLATINPKLAKEWHPSKNGELTPNNVGIGSIKKVWWKCEKGDDHEWINSVNGRMKDGGRGCPICSNQLIVVSNSLATTNPKLAKQWHPYKNNNSIDPNNVSEGSNKKVWWQCEKGNNHEWRASISSRNRGNGCPFCTLTPQSRQELIITFELKNIFNINPKGFKTRVNGKLWSIDIYIPEINLGIEFDGAYWHKGKRELDKLKTEQLHLKGFHIIRVRQEPLKRIFDTDVIASKDFNGKQITNDILNQILKDHSLDSKTISKINNYLALDSLQNEKELDKYIDKILEEKVKRKVKRTTTKPKLH
ncbi:zinc-ribbon domain-containing protein [Flavobacteriaceae bacterium]|nr:zinc-ribbon domain-containing protein [Flavobacteriaceae bacterium]